MHAATRLAEKIGTLDPRTPRRFTRLCAATDPSPLSMAFRPRIWLRVGVRQENRAGQSSFRSAHTDRRRQNRFRHRPGHDSGGDRRRTRRSGPCMTPDTTSERRTEIRSGTSQGAAPQGVAGEEAASRWVRGMFGKIAGQYDLLNHLLSFNLDKRWRAVLVQHVAQALANRESPQRVWTYAAARVMSCWPWNRNEGLGGKLHARRCSAATSAIRCSWKRAAKSRRRDRGRLCSKPMPSHCRSPTNRST